MFCSCSISTDKRVSRSLCNSRASCRSSEANCCKLLYSVYFTTVMNRPLTSDCRVAQFCILYRITLQRRTDFHNQYVNGRSSTGLLQNRTIFGQFSTITVYDFGNGALLWRLNAVMCSCKILLKSISEIELDKTVSSIEYGNSVFHNTRSLPTDRPPDRPTDRQNGCIRNLARKNGPHKLSQSDAAWLDLYFLNE